MKTFNECIERMDVFSDSDEVADGVDSMYSEQHNYWPREASIHIRGLWEVAEQLAKHGKRMQKRIKELEAREK
jgi:ribonuclease HI